MISQRELKFETSKLLEVLENANDQGVIVFSIYLICVENG